MDFVESAATLKAELSAPCRRSVSFVGVCTLPQYESVQFSLAPLEMPALWGSKLTGRIACNRTERLFLFWGQQFFQFFNILWDSFKINFERLGNYCGNRRNDNMNFESWQLYYKARNCWIEITGSKTQKPEKYQKHKLYDS